MPEEEYQLIKNRLVEDFWSWFGHKVYEFFLYFMEVVLKIAGAMWPIILTWLKKNGYLDI